MGKTYFSFVSWICRPDSAPTEVYSPRLRSSSRLHSPATPNDKLPMTPCDRPPHSPVERPPPKIPRLSPKVTPPPRHEAVDTEDSESDELPSRRMTRHAYQEEIRKCRSAAAAAGSGSRSSQSEARKRRHTSGQRVCCCLIFFVFFVFQVINYRPEACFMKSS